MWEQTCFCRWLSLDLEKRIPTTCSLRSVPLTLSQVSRPGISISASDSSSLPNTCLVISLNTRSVSVSQLVCWIRWDSPFSGGFGDSASFDFPITLTCLSLTVLSGPFNSILTKSQHPSLRKHVTQPANLFSTSTVLSTIKSSGVFPVLNVSEPTLFPMSRPLSMWTATDLACRLLVSFRETHLVLFLSSSPLSQKVSVLESVRLGTIACLEDTLTSAWPVRSLHTSTPLSC